VEGLNTLTNLKMLDLGKNKIATIANLDALTWLTQLSIEDNDIENLQVYSTKCDSVVLVVLFHFPKSPILFSTRRHLWLLLLLRIMSRRMP
jgi:Leucine-rich repeat (LRR) protein